MVKWFKDKDMLFRLLALGIAVLMWMFVINEENPDYSKTYRNIPMQIDGVEHLSRSNLVIVNGGSATISAKITGKRDRMKLISSDKLLAAVDVSSITEPGTYPLNFTVRVDVPDVTVTTKSPQQITVEVVRFSSASVPVTVELTGALGADLTAKGCSVTPNAITVRGPEEVVARIKSARIKYNLSGVESSVNEKTDYELLDYAGNPVKDKLLTVDAPSVQLKIPLVMTKRIPLTIGYYSSDLISADLIQATMSVDSLLLEGDPDVIRNLNQIQVGSISLRNMVEADLRNYSFFFILPNGVSYAPEQEAVSKVSVQIELPGYTTREITASSAYFMAPSNFTYVDQTVTFRVFGKQEDLENLTEEDFFYTPSFSPSALKPGQQVVLMRVSAKDSSVKVLGSYAVKIRVPKP